MKKFILLYKGPATPMGEMSKEDNDKQMAAWGVWMGKVGTALVDMGSPLGESRVVVDDGSSAKASELNGYSILEADDIDAAVDLVDGHPFLSDKSGNFSVEVFELLPVPDM